MKKWFYCKKCGRWHLLEKTTVVRCPTCGYDITWFEDELQ